MESIFNLHNNRIYLYYSYNICMVKRKILKIKFPSRNCLCVSRDDHCHILLIIIFLLLIHHNFSSSEFSFIEKLAIHIIKVLDNLPFRCAGSLIQPSHVRGSDSVGHFGPTSSYKLLVIIHPRPGIVSTLYSKVGS